MEIEKAKGKQKSGTIREGAFLWWVNEERDSIMVILHHH